MRTKPKNVIDILFIGFKIVADEFIIQFGVKETNHFQVWEDYPIRKREKLDMDNRIIIK
jgi:hypothetical protein